MLRSRNKRFSLNKRDNNKPLLPLSKSDSKRPSLSKRDSKKLWSKSNRKY